MTKTYNVEYWDYDGAGVFIDAQDVEASNLEEAEEIGKQKFGEDFIVASPGSWYDNTDIADLAEGTEEETK